MAPYPTSTYKVSKAAVNMLTVQWALDLAKEDFTIISTHPGVCSPSVRDELHRSCANLTSTVVENRFGHRPSRPAS